jgi:hypothetical protein
MRLKRKQNEKLSELVEKNRLRLNKNGLSVNSPLESQVQGH